MKSNLRDRFRDFLASEEGRVGIKAPLTLGIAGGSLLLAQAMLPTAAQADMECSSDADCNPGETCQIVKDEEWSPGCGCWVEVWHSACV